MAFYTRKLFAEYTTAKDCYWNWFPSSSITTEFKYLSGLLLCLQSAHTTTYVVDSHMMDATFYPSSVNMDFLLVLWVRKMIRGAIQQ